MIPERVYQAARIVRAFDDLKEGPLKEYLARAGVCIWVSAIASVPDSLVRDAPSITEITDELPAIITHNASRLGNKWRRIISGQPGPFRGQTPEIVERISGGRARILDCALQIEKSRDGQFIDAIVASPKVFLNEQGQLGRMNPEERVTGILLEQHFAGGSGVDHVMALVPDGEISGRTIGKQIRKSGMHLVVDATLRDNRACPGLGFFTGEEIALRAFKPSEQGETPLVRLIFVASRP